MRSRNAQDDVKTGFLDLAQGKPKGNLLTDLTTSGIELARTTWRLLRGTWKSGYRTPVRIRVSIPYSGTDQLVVVMKFL
jgi:hypothetical protein